MIIDTYQHTRETYLPVIISGSGCQHEDVGCHHYQDWLHPWVWIVDMSELCSTTNGKRRGIHAVPAPRGSSLQYGTSHISGWERNGCWGRGKRRGLWEDFHFVVCLWWNFERWTHNHCQLFLQSSEEGGDEKDDLYKSAMDLDSIIGTPSGDEDDGAPSASQGSQGNLCMFHFMFLQASGLLL